MGVFAALGLSCLIFPYIGFGHIFGASIAFGVGCDDILVMMAYLESSRSDSTKNAKESFKEGFKKAGVAVTVTSLTTTLCFGATAVSVYQVGKLLEYVVISVVY